MKTLSDISSDISALLDSLDRCRTEAFKQFAERLRAAGKTELHTGEEGEELCGYVAGFEVPSRYALHGLRIEDDAVVLLGSLEGYAFDPESDESFPEPSEIAAQDLGTVIDALSELFDEHGI